MMNRYWIYAAIAAGVVAVGFVVIVVINSVVFDRDERASLDRDHATGTTSGADAATPAGQTADGGGDGGMVAVNRIGGGRCKALVPDGWSATFEAPDGSRFAAQSADGTMQASYTSVGVDAAAIHAPDTVAQACAIARQEGLPAAGACDTISPDTRGDQFSSAQSTVEYGIRQAMGQGVQFDPNLQAGPFDYQILHFTMGGGSGFVMYRSYSTQAGMAIGMRTAFASAGASARALSIAGTVATSIRCDQQLTPPPPANTANTGGSGPAETASSTRCQVWSPNCDDSDFAGTYNAQLGTGYVHSETCHNYVVDPDTDRNENGPDGPGYYRRVGNNVEKLLPGRCDD